MLYGHSREQGVGVRSNITTLQIRGVGQRNNSGFRLRRRPGYVCWWMKLMARRKLEEAQGQFSHCSNVGMRELTP